MLFIVTFCKNVRHPNQHIAIDVVVPIVTNESFSSDVVLVPHNLTETPSCSVTVRRVNCIVRSNLLSG